MSDKPESVLQETEFASPERAEEQEILKSLGVFNSSKILSEALESLQEIILILNDKRQIVYSNRKLLSMLGFSESAQICGLRPGELLKCAHAENSSGGCGTSCYCKVCGAVNAILESQRTGEKVVKECQMIRNGGRNALTLMTAASPLNVGDENFVVLSITDVSEVKMKEILERMFFHDALNLAGGIKGLAELLRDEPADQRTASIAQIILDATVALIDEIKSQRELIMAEKGELKPNIIPLSSLDIIKAVSSFYRKNEVANGKGITLKRDSVDVRFESDTILVNRILGNMLKNALEAIPRAGIVSIGCYPGEAPWKVDFRVSNPGVIPPDVQLSIFQRAFSTKGAGRGLGTYGMKLIGENYLKGSVGFVSNESDGTVFHFKLK